MKTLRRSHNKMLGGVCAGIAEYLDIDPTVVRLAAVLLTPYYLVGVWIYLVCWIVMPDR